MARLTESLEENSMSPDAADKLKRLRYSLAKAYSQNKDPKNLLVIHDQQLFVWNPEDSTIQCHRLKRDHSVADVQVLVLTNAPVFDVDCLVFSTTGRYLAVAGARGINVVELPRKWGPSAAYEGGKGSILCRTWTLCERLFVCNRQILLLEAAWHPASETDQHIVLLTNDNAIRIFDVTDTEAPLVHAKLSDASALEGNFSAFATSLGDSAVSFDFGPPVATTWAPAASDGTDGGELCKKEDCIWPIYVLRGNGDVILSYHTLKENNWKLKQRVFGPLTMLPAAEDNYGTDACKLLCLDSNPPILVVATSTGIIYHCLVLDSDFSDDNIDDDQLYGLHQRPQQRPSFDLPKPTLYVYESVELTLSLTAAGPGDQEINSPIRIYRDHTASNRYILTHGAGLHAVHLPLVNQLSSSDLSSAEPCIVEHLICTKPLASSSSSDLAPPLGLVVTWLNGTTCLKVILSDGTMINRSLAPAVSAGNDGRASDSSLSRREDGETAAAPRIDLSEHIVQILKRSSNMPLLQSKKQINASGEELLQLVLNTTEVLKQEYLQKQELASRALDKRVKALTNEKRVQLEEAARCSNDKRLVIEGVKRLSSKYDSTIERQRLLSARLERVLDALHNAQDTPSDAEKNMKRELLQIKEKLAAFNNVLNQVESKYAYQRDAIGEQERSNSSSGRQSRADLRRNTSLSSPGMAQPAKNQIASFAIILENEGAQIQKLIHRINHLKEEYQAD